MDHSHRNANLILLLASAIWGFAFVAQRMGMQHMGPLAFNAIRFALGAMVLLPLLFFGLPGQKPVPLIVGQRKHLLLGGLLTGFLIFGGATLQQFGVVHTTAGKAGFITGLYVVFVPLLGLLRGLKTAPRVWAGVGLAAVGLYLLSGKGWGGIQMGDGLVLIGTLFWASHMLAIGWLAPRVNPLALAVLQFLVCSLLSAWGALVFEDLPAGAIRNAAVPILYAGVLSVGVAYTLQIIGQRKAQPAHAALILSMEGVFAALGGWIILSESLSLRGMLGCCLMLGGIILAQWQPSGRKKTPDMV
jgi:drug/metabolite transporter (DMT)-like permease